MTARQQIGYFGPTPNPWGDYERWADSGEHEDAALQARQAQAAAVVLRSLLVPADQWEKSADIGGLYTSPDELLFDAREAEDDEVIKLYRELMTSPAALKLREAVASFHGDASPWMGD